MPHPSIWTRALEGILSIGASDDESESQRSGRRVFMLAFILASLLSVPAVIARFAAGYTWVGVSDLVTLVVPVSLLVVIAGPSNELRARPARDPRHPLRQPDPRHGDVRGAVAVGRARDLRLGYRPRRPARARPRRGPRLVGRLRAVRGVRRRDPRFVDPIYTLDDPAGNAAFNLIGTAS